MSMDEHERAASGMDFDDDEKSFVERLFEGGPEAILDNLEEMVPDSLRENITRYPLTALTIGFGVGLYLGMKRGDEVLSAGSAMLSAAATANLAQIMSDLGID